MQTGFLWRRGDWGGYFGLLSNNLTNLLTMTGLLLFVVGFPKDVVFGEIVPAFGLAIFVASLSYTYFAYRLTKSSGRSDVTALPSGPSSPSIFTVTFLVILPLYIQTKNHQFALQVGLVWCFAEAMILALGAFLGDAIRRAIPRTVLLSCLAGLGLLLLAMNPMLQSFAAPTVAFVVLLLIFLNWFGKKPLLPKIPTGFLLLVVGTALAWAFGLQSADEVQKSLSTFGFNPPQLHVRSFFEGLPHALPHLASAIPLGLANYVFDLENIESAHAAGDPYPTRQVMLMNGVSSAVGAMFGNPYPVTVYIGHAGWKSIGAGTGYTFFCGLTMLLVSLFGLGAFLLALMPTVVVVPILVYVGVVTCNQVVRESPKDEVPVIFITMFPWIANWGLSVVNSALAAAGTAAKTVGIDKLATKGVYYQGLANLGNGAPLSSMIWGCIAIFAIKDRPLAGAAAALVGALLSFAGVIHSPAVGIAQPHAMPLVYGYCMMAAVFAFQHFLHQRDGGAPGMAKPQPGMK
jgi:AGZA family xanthine/uracil permease-like MFS transporter